MGRDRCCVFGADAAPAPRRGVGPTLAETQERSGGDASRRLAELDWSASLTLGCPDPGGRRPEHPPPAGAEHDGGGPFHAPPLHEMWGIVPRVRCRGRDSNPYFQHDQAQARMTSFATPAAPEKRRLSGPVRGPTGPKCRFGRDLCRRLAVDDCVLVVWWRGRCCSGCLAVYIELERLARRRSSNCGCTASTALRPRHRRTGRDLLRSLQVDDPRKCSWVCSSTKKLPWVELLFA